LDLSPFSTNFWIKKFHYWTLAQLKRAS
jgi:hypothetical protein